MAATEDARAGTCAQCGAGFVRTYSHKRFCSEACRKRAEHERGIAREFRCEGCAGTFRPKRSDRTRFCSRGCAHAAQRTAAARAAEARRLLLPEVQALRRMASGMGSSLRRLTLLCERRQRALAVCGHCAKAVGVRRTKTFPARYCSDECADAHPGAVEGRRTWRLKRKARQRAATVESVNVLRVFERDGWRCHLCGGLTLKTKRGTYHPKAPELDHIVPLSKGGEHSYRNTACAHRACNAAKSDTIMGQPSLLAA